MTDLEKLLGAHNAIIRAWYDKWLAEHQAKIDAFWAKRKKPQSGDAGQAAGN